MIVYFNDDTDDSVHSFNVDEVKDYEVKENFVLELLVQNAFAPATPKDDMGSNGSKL